MNHVQITYIKHYWDRKRECKRDKNIFRRRQEIQIVWLEFYNVIVVVISDFTYPLLVRNKKFKRFLFLCRWSSKHNIIPWFPTVFFYLLSPLHSLSFYLNIALCTLSGHVSWDERNPKPGAHNHKRDVRWNTPAKYIFIETVYQNWFPVETFYNERL